MAQSGNRPFVRRYRYYEILEVSRNATQGEIRRAYLKLAKVYHPDVNPDAKAHEKFKKINEAYEILSDPARRPSYDNSPAECPVCWTHEVIQTTGIHWRCRHCGCKFDPSRVSEIIEQVEKAAIPERRRNVIRIFQTTQCSWCRKFYTQPFLCPYNKLQSSCISFDRLGNEERGQLLGDEKWWWRMADMIQQVQERGIMAKCRECGALNPNPKKPVCWHCGKDTLCCPHCQKRGQQFILRYNIEGEFWKCPNAGCSKKFALRPKKRIVEPTLSQEVCPNCGKNLYYDAELLLWRCRNCKHIYTQQDLQSQRVHRKAGPRKTEQTRPRAERSYRPPKKWWPRRMRAGPRTRKFLMGIAKLLLCLLVIAGISVIVWTGYRLFTQQISPVIGTIAFLAEIGLLIWIISVLRSSRFRWRKPSFKLVFFSLLGIVLVCAFAGIEPMSSVKDRVTTWVGETWETITTSSESPTQTPEDLASAVARVEPAVVRVEAEESIGSGMIIDESGYILTSNHIVENVQSATIILKDGGQFPGAVISRDEFRDLAIIKISASGFDFPVATLGNSDELETGEEIVAIGYSLGLEGEATVSKGIISAFRTGDGVLYIQTDASLNPGNSGGPLINSKGEVVGIVTAKVVEEAVEGMGFAIAINDAKSFIADVMEGEQALEETQREEQALLALEQETLRLINVERENRGIPPIVWDETLHNGARIHSQNMQQEGFLYHDTQGMFAECCYGASYAASIYATAEATVEAWMSSTAGHREILLDPQYRHGAIGIARDKGFWATYRCH
jgi:ribosomal protein L37AE/L43A